MAIKRIRFAILIAIVSCAIHQCRGLPLPKSEIESSSEHSALKIKANLTSNEAGPKEDKDEEIVFEDQDEPIDSSTEQVEPLSSPIPIRVLAPIDMMIENEIWQYRYPPFDNLFTPTEAPLNNRGARQQDALPSYVIGILDPAELVDGLFNQQRNNRPSNNRNSFVQPIEFVRLEHQNEADLGSNRGVFAPDDRWVWNSN